MAVSRALLLIADIGGYTRFMTVHRINLAHAQDTVARLLEAIIDAAGPFKLAKLEGDAAFFSAPADTKLGELIKSIRRAFLRQRLQLALDRACSCEGCTQIEGLTLKFVAHEGEVATQRVKRYVELAGVDVILLHRMLKNTVPVPEYVLATDSALARLDGLASHASALTHDFEGIGPTRTHYVDLAALGDEGAEAQPRGFFGKLWEKVKMELRGLPYLLGLKKPCDGFRNFDRRPAERTR
ncbi:MAG: DUF2652 domain-containing protein [Myxococcaceae bacterium]